MKQAEAKSCIKIHISPEYQGWRDSAARAGALGVEKLQNQPQPFFLTKGNALTLTHHSSSRYSRPHQLYSQQPGSQPPSITTLSKAPDKKKKGFSARCENTRLLCSAAHRCGTKDAPR
ncbi:hypothetical protein DUNSADRAFT_4551 [Dunaliella salina]|uniref:Encoded protein n=1 Tax=Dunaliella salina TaxID=3046 RepID=A0ABQ7GRS5_DUNSA|nr:hypothetical protein DUNSADRAFT_4551 [Dunaliella salina]|eukprot:KAF5837288.1 hypothetical protein DUNSADRAFT_4551 [Dunaliella salina]